MSPILRPSPNPSRRRRGVRFSSAPDGSHKFSVSLEPTPILRKAPPLTPDNAHSVLAVAIDAAKFMKTFGVEMNKKEVISLLGGCVVDSESVAFSNVAQRHLEALGLDVELDLDLEQGLVAKANDPTSPSNAIINTTSLDAFQRHFNVSKESGCRCIIGQYLVAALVYSQSIIDADEGLKSELAAEYKVNKPHLAVFTELPLPPARVTCDGVSYVFYGVIDYGIGFIHKRDVDILRPGGLGIDPSKALAGVIEAKSMKEMDLAAPQIIAQIVTALGITQRPVFTGVLTNGAMWRFYVAHNGEDKLRIYSSEMLSTEKHQGLIIELLKDMLLYDKSPLFTCEFPPPAELEDVEPLEKKHRVESIENVNT